MKESGLKILCGAAKIEIHAHDDTDKIIRRDTMRQPIFVCVKSRPDIEAFIYHEEPNVIYINTACTRPGIIKIVLVPKDEQ